MRKTNKQKKTARRPFKRDTLTAHRRRLSISAVGLIGKRPAGQWSTTWYLICLMMRRCHRCSERPTRVNISCHRLKSTNKFPIHLMIAILNHVYSLKRNFIDLITFQALKGGGGTANCNRLLIGCWSSRDHLRSKAGFKSKRGELTYRDRIEIKSDAISVFFFPKHRSVCRSGSSAEAEECTRRRIHCAPSDRFLFLSFFLSFFLLFRLITASSTSRSQGLS